MTSAPENYRLRSLDVFRGFTIASMVLVNNPGDWTSIYAPLKHAAWHGWTFTDWIFPFFLFIVGVSMTLSTSRSLAGGTSKPKLLLQLWRRAMVIVMIGLALNFVPSFNWETLRYPGVLQRIGVCIIIAAPLILWFRAQGQFAWAAALMVVYAGAMLLVPVPDSTGVAHAGLLEPGRDVGAYVDRALMSGHLWAQSKSWDPEGLVSTLPAVSSLLFGALTGHGLRTQASPAAKTSWMMVFGLFAIWVGVILDAWLMPINKSLWTPSYAVFMTGWALLVFAACYWLIDACDSNRVREWATSVAQPFEIYGVNALFIFALSGLVAKALGYFKMTTDAGAMISVKVWMFQALSQWQLQPVNASLLFAVIFNLAMFGVAWTLWRNKIFIKV